MNLALQKKKKRNSFFLTDVLPKPPPLSHGDTHSGRNKADMPNLCQGAEIPSSIGVTLGYMSPE